MDRFPQMLFRAGRELITDSGPMDTFIVADDAALSAALADGWHESPAATSKAVEIPPDEAPPTRAELEQKATELGIKWDGRWGDKRLSDAISAALKG